MQEKKISCERIENWLQGSLSDEASQAMEKARQESPELSKMVNDCEQAMAAVRFYSEQRMREKIKGWDEKLPPGQDVPPPVPFSFSSWLLVLLFCLLGVGTGSTGLLNKHETPASPPKPAPAELPPPMAQATLFQPMLPDLETRHRQPYKTGIKARQPAVQRYCILLGRGDIKGMREAEDWVRANGYSVDKKKRDYKNGTFKIVAVPSDIEAGTWMLDVAAQPPTFAIVDIIVETDKFYM